MRYTLLIITGFLGLMVTDLFILEATKQWAEQASSSSVATMRSVIGLGATWLLTAIVFTAAYAKLNTSPGPYFLVLHTAGVLGMCIYMLVTVVTTGMFSGLLAAEACVAVALLFPIVKLIIKEKPIIA